MTHSLPITKLGRTGRVVIFSDVHIGAIEHDERRFDEALAEAWEMEAHLIMNGDIAENAVLAEGDKSAADKLMGQALCPMEQVRVAADKFGRFAKAGRIIGSTRGNHEARSRRSSLLDLSEILAELLDVPYLGIGGLIRLTVPRGRRTFHLAAHHGTSGAKNIWLELDRLSALYPSADVVVAGHNHALDARRLLSIVLDDAGRERHREVWQVRTGTFLGFAEYARAMGLRPGRVGCPVVTFHQSGEVRVDTETLSWPAS